MICPECSATNGETNRFCRECGFRLEGVPGSAGQEGQADVRRDEVALGQELFKVWQLFEAGELDGALREGEAIVRRSPESASAHSLVALIYERKAEQELARGGTDGALPYFRLAIAQYERIVDMNPDSTADREKLASLRARISTQRAPDAAPALAGLRAVVRAVPPQFLAAFAGFLAVLVVLIVLIPGGGKGSVKGSRDALDRESGRVGVPATQSVPVAPPERPLNVYTFPAAPSADRSVPTPPEARAIATAPEPVKPAPVPPRPPEPKIVLEPAAPRPSAPNASPRASAPPAQEEPGPDPDVPASSGSTVLARAIELNNLGRNAEAIAAAQQAIALFQADIDAGRNTTVAQRGIANARKLVRVWQQSIVVTAEEQ